MSARSALTECFGDDIGETIWAHMAALRIQRHWVRYVLYGHVTSEWGEVRTQLIAAGVFRHLFRYSKVRREWRLEARSWWHTPLHVLEAIDAECEEGLWGFASLRFTP